MYSVFVQLCEKNGVTAYKVCKELGISQGTISNWKNRGNNLSAPTMKKIADYFGVSVDVFFGGVIGPEGNDEKKEEDAMYYFDDKSKQYMEFLHKHPEYSALFDASQKVKPEDIQKALKAIGIFIDED